ncbi:MAG: MmgE/PrpD family protein, partial [Gammaproteobacteria bacterium]
VYFLDTLGVGLTGSAGPYTRALIESQRASGAGAEARVWGHRDTWLSAASAAACNAYQIHNCEFDCVHEAAVVHPMAVLSGALVAFAEREARVHGRRISGRDLLLGVVLGVDVAAGLGIAARSGLRFFRPATAGGIGAALAIGNLMGFDRERLVTAASIAYAQTCGTMQAHVEGSMLLGMQVGFNARNALVACDMAGAGIPAPREVLEGQFGYFKLIETESDLQPVLESLGRTWRIEEVAHKPFPSGRATHGIVDACLTLAAVYGFSGAQVKHVNATVPPLTHRLVSRPSRTDMSPNYARLSGAYVAAVALTRGHIGIEDFSDNALHDADTLTLAERIEIQSDDSPDPNALTPICVEIELNNGNKHALDLDIVYGNPAKPMMRDAYLQKFTSNWMSAAAPGSSAHCTRAIELLENLHTLEDATSLFDLLSPAAR